MMGLKQQMQALGYQQAGSQGYNGNAVSGNQNFGGIPPLIPPRHVPPPGTSGANPNRNSTGTTPIVSSANHSFQGALMQALNGTSQMPPGGRPGGQGRGRANNQNGGPRFPPPPHQNANGGPGVGFHFGAVAGVPFNGNANNRTRRTQEDYENRDGNSFRLCKVCQEANAWACNHCQICHEVSHRTGNCPRQNDPNFDPSKNP